MLKLQTLQKVTLQGNKASQYISKGHKAMLLLLMLFPSIEQVISLFVFSFYVVILINYCFDFIQFAIVIPGLKSSACLVWKH